MPQSDGIHRLRRMEFEFMGQTYKFALNPEEYRQSEPSRITVTQTKGGAFADDFGAGVPSIYFKGTTGFRNTEMRNYLNDTGDGSNNQQRFLEGLVRQGSLWAQQELEKTLTGFLKFKELRDLIRRYYTKAPPGAIITPDLELVYHNYTDDEHWVVTPKTFDLMRSVSRPLMYLYEVQLVCMRRADEPTQADEGNMDMVLNLFDVGEDF